MMPAASAIILAGGQSRRMGRPKAALRFGNRSILERLITELSTSFDEILVAAAPEQVEPFAIEHLLLMAHSPARLRARAGGASATTYGAAERAGGRSG
jgi:molybdenum cofactor guanylyltransferase